MDACARGHGDALGLKIAMFLSLSACEAWTSARDPGFDQNDGQITTIQVTARNNPLEAAFAKINTGHRLAPDQVAGFFRSPGPTGPVAPFRIGTGLGALWRVDTPKANALAGDFQRIAVDDARRAMDFCLPCEGRQGKQDSKHK